MKTTALHATRDDASGVPLMLVNATTTFGEARETLLDALAHVRSLIPKPVRIAGLDDISGVKQLSEAALEMERVADKLKGLVSEVFSLYSSASDSVPQGRGTERSPQTPLFLSIPALVSCYNPGNCPPFALPPKL